MEKFKVKIEGADKEDQQFNFECYDNTETIEIGDAFLFFFAGIADVQICDSENMKEELNPNDRVSTGFGDLVTGFWKNAYKIKETDFNLEEIRY